MNEQNLGLIPLDSKTAPLYDRGYASGLTLGDASSNLEGYMLLYICNFY